MKNIVEIYNNTIKLLKNNSKVELRKASIGLPVSREIIEKAETLMKMPLTEEIKDFYLAANGFTIEWAIGKSDSGLILYGWIDIWPLEKMIGGENGNLDLDDAQLKKVFEEMLILDNDSDELRAELEKHRMIESHWGAASYTTIRFDKKDGLKLYYVDNYIQYPLPLSFTDYIRFTIETLGVDPCRLGLKEESFYADPYKFCNELREVKKEFPETDLCRIAAFCKK